MVIFIRATASTPSPKDTFIGVNVNRPLSQDWTTSLKASIIRNLKGFSQGQSTLIAVTEDDNLVKFIDVGVESEPPDKWTVELIQDSTLIAMSPEIDRFATNLFDFGKLPIIKQPEAPTTDIVPPIETPTIPEEDAVIVQPDIIEPPKDDVVVTTVPTTISGRPKDITVKRPVVGSFDLPFGFGWLKPLLDFFNNWFASLKKDMEIRANRQIEESIESRFSLTKDVKGVTDSVKGITAFIDDPVGFVQKSFRGAIKGIAQNKELIIEEAEVELVTNSLKEEQFTTPEMKRAVVKLRKGMTGTPQDISGFINTVFIEPTAIIRQSVEAFLVPEPPVSFADANKARDRLFALVVDFWILATILDIVATAISATLIRNIVKHAQNFIIMLNFGDLIKLAVEPAMQAAIGNPLKFGFNEKFQSNKLGVSDAIEAVVKEVITLDDFIIRMRRLGFDETESRIIWDKHFIAPTLTDILTAWRRGLIKEERVDELMILVDLDPRFKEIFDTRKFIDPSLTAARFMFEVGAIDEARVKEIVKRQGFLPEDVESLTGFVVGFQSRLWRRRYLITLARSFELGLTDESTLRVEVVAANYTSDVADWIVKNAQLRKTIDETAPKERLLTKTDVARAFERGIITRDEAEVKLADMGFDVSDVEILLSLREPETI